MTIKDQIIAGSKMGYSAMLKFQSFKDIHSIVGIDKGFVYMKGEDSIPTKFISHFCFNALSLFKIIGWIYVGQLFGEPVIPDGQKFRVKATGDVYSFTGFDDKNLEFKNETIFTFHQSEVEPYFD